MATHDLWHGTEAGPFDRFDPAFHGRWKFGFWFTPERSFAEAFAGDTGNLVSARVTLERPRTITTEQWNDIRDRHAKDGPWFAAWRLNLESQGYDGLWVKEDLWESSRGVKFFTPAVCAIFKPEAIQILEWQPKIVAPAPR